MLSSRVAKASPVALLCLFCLVNILNYIDRGIVPGAFSSIGEFIREDGGGGNSTDTQIGLLQSAFVVGYSVSALGLGHAAQHYPPFKLMAGGLAVWAAAAILSGLAPRFWVLLLARCFSGVGEASFQTVVPPFIEDNAPPKSRGLYLSLFYVAIPVGTALGYGLGGVAPWRWAFIGEALPMLLLLPLLWVLPDGRSKGAPTAPTVVADAGTSSSSSRGGRGPLLSTSKKTAYAKMPTNGSGDEKEPAEAASLSSTLRGEGGGGGITHPAPAAAGEETGTASQHKLTLLVQTGPAEAEAAIPIKHTFLAELGGCLSDPVYMSAVLGYAGFTAVIAGEREVAAVIVLDGVAVPAHSSCLLFCGLPFLYL